MTEKKLDALFIAVLALLDSQINPNSNDVKDLEDALSIMMDVFTQKEED